MEEGRRLEVSELLDNQNETIAWIESQPCENQAEIAETGFSLLLREAGQPKSSSGNACVRLCGYVDHMSRSESQTLRGWAFSRDVAERLFTFYIEWNESDQHRSMKLVLDLTVQLRKRNPDQAAVVETEKELLDDLVAIAVGRSTKPVAKSAIKTIDHFITKGIFTVGHLRAAYIRCEPQADCGDENEVWGSFFAHMFPWLRVNFICPTAGRFIVLLYRTLRSRKNAELPLELWHRWLLDVLAGNPALLETIKNYVFIPLFKADRPEALAFLRMVSNHKAIGESEDIDMDMPTLLQLAALETGKRVGLVEEPALSMEATSGEKSSSLVLHETILTSVLSHPAHAVRALAFSLLITSPSTTRPYSPTALSLLKKHMGTFFADPDAKFRVDVMTGARDMFKRVRGSICVLKRSIPRARAKARERETKQEKKPQQITYHTNLISLPEAQLVQCLDDHVRFLRWYIGFLCGELTPTAAYQRHVGSLKALASIFRVESQASTTWETADDQEILFDLFDGTWMRALLDLLMDPFDDVRDMAAASLKTILSDKKYRRFTLKSPTRDGSSSDELEDFLSRSNEVARRTARADHADGAARAAQLVYRSLDGGDRKWSFVSSLISQLEKKLSAAESDLGLAVLEAPVHGDFAALRYIWQVAAETKLGQGELESAGAMQLRLVECCSRIWNAVREILCDDSPEGHLPQELEEVDGINTKDVLSYSFRSVHEASTLMRTIVLSLRNQSKDGYITPSSSSFAEIGNLSFEQLSTLRHRGAFTTVSMTFATCCQQTKHLDGDDGTSLLNAWYKGTMEAIFAQASTTRRSAGIPSLITGILSSNAEEPSFERVMEELMRISSMEARVRETDGTNLPQVHAYNCLKDIFKNSLLTYMGNKSEKYIPQCLELAANGLKSEIWAIRNCSLILLRSLINRLFGTHESKSMIEAGWDGKANRIAYHRYPTLPGVLVNLLKSGHQMMSSSATHSAGAESVFPSLDIVRRAGPPDRLRDELQVHISKYLANPVWHVREMAARTLCSCLLHAGWLKAIKELLQAALRDTTANAQNHVHGILMALRFVFERLSEVAVDQLTANMTDLAASLKESKIDVRYANCPDILSAYLEVVNQMSSFRIFNAQPCEKIDVTLPSTYGSALLKLQVVTYHTYAAYESNTPIQALRDVYLKGGLGADTMTTALELLPKLWTPSSITDAVASDLCTFYVDLCLGTTMTGPRAVAVESLADILCHQLEQRRFGTLQASQLSALWASFPVGPVSPALSDAILRISGCVTAILLHSEQLPASGLRAWGLMVTDAGLDDKGFDTRFSAAEALQIFFAATGNSCTGEEYLPALLALYDALNDDDDEVRDVAAAAVRGILGVALTPLEAASRLLDWLATTFPRSTTFKKEVATRLTGSKGTTSWKSADSQITAALAVDDSLFAVEEQNLFIDEAREARRWSSVLPQLEWDDNDASLAALSAWLHDGLVRLQGLVEKDDGPLGWASDEHVFAVCSNLVICSVAVISGGYATAQLRGEMGRMETAMRSNEDRRISGLLVQPLRGDPRADLA